MALGRVAGPYFENERAWPVATVQGVERMAEITLPKGTSLIEARGYTGWYGGLRAVFVMPRSAVRAFLEAPPFEGEPSSSERPEWRESTWQDQAPPRDWRPDKAEDFLAATGHEWTGADIVNWSALADLNGPDAAIVYFEWDRH